MPISTNFSQEKILDEAFNILRNEGIGELSARKIARNLGCSTQPVYSTFSSMKELQEAVIKKARKYAIDYLLKNKIENDHSLALGMQYFRFSQEEKVLFKILFLEGEMAMTLATMPEFSGPLVERMKQDEYLQGLSEESIKRIGRDMWIYTHGLVSFLYNSEDGNFENTVYSKLYHMGGNRY